MTNNNVMCPAPYLSGFETCFWRDSCWHSEDEWGPGTDVVGTGLSQTDTHTNNGIYLNPKRWKTWLQIIWMHTPSHRHVRTCQKLRIDWLLCMYACAAVAHCLATSQCVCIHRVLCLQELPVQPPPPYQLWGCLYGMVCFSCLCFSLCVLWGTVFSVWLTTHK